MIPILFEQNEKNFISNGLGVLSDAMEAKVTEERNSVFELSMIYPINGKHYEDLKPGRIILVKPSWDQEPQPFDILTVTPSTDGMRAEVYGQHISYRLNGVPVTPFEATGITQALDGLVKHAMIQHSFTTWTDITNQTSKFSVKEPKSLRACLGGQEGSILQTFSGSGGVELIWDKFLVKVVRHRGQDQGVMIRYGKNLVSLKQETSIENSYTGVVAYWKDSNEDEIVIGGIQYAFNHEEYAHERIFLYDCSSEYQQKPNVKDLNQKAATYVKNNHIGVPSVNLTVSFIDISQTLEYQNVAPLERVNLCDTVHIEFPLLHVSASAKVIKTVWDVLKDRYESIELGDEKRNLYDTIHQNVQDVITPKIEQSQTFLEQAIEQAATLIKGGVSGHMVIGTNANGEANELYFMDTDDKESAKNILRINQNGIAFSSMGINGKYTTAWTIDGHFVADFINSGKIDGNLIEGGTIKAGALDTALTNKINGTIQDVNVEYAISDSNTTSPETGWQTDAPEWQEGKYIWQRTATTLSDGTTKFSNSLCITGIKGEDGKPGEKGVGVKLITEEYYLSTSNTEQAGGSWSSNSPSWYEGAYIWTRSKIDWDNNTTSYTTPVLANAINGANEIANEAKTTADDASNMANQASKDAAEAENTASDASQKALEAISSQNTAVSSTAIEYYSSTSSFEQKDGTWAVSIPTYDENRFIWMRSKYTLKDGTTVTSMPICLTAGVQTQLSEMQQLFYADSTGAHVKVSNGYETIMQGDGLHIMVNGAEVAKYTSGGGFIGLLTVDSQLFVGWHRVEKLTIDNQQGTAFYYVGG